MKNKLLTGIGALAFVVLMALNVHLVNNPTGNQDHSNITLVELAAKAQSNSENPNPEKPNSSITFTCYTDDGYYCRLGVNCVYIENGSGCTKVTCTGC